MRAFWSTIVDCRKSLPDKGGRDVLGERVAEYAWPQVSLFSWYLTIFILLDYTFWLRNKGLAGAALLCLIIWVNLHFNAAVCYFPPPMERAEFPCCGDGEKETPTPVARLGDLLIFLFEFIPRESCMCVPACPMQRCFLPCHPYSRTCLDNTLCPTSLLSSVIHCQVINHQQYRKYLARQKWENTSTPYGNRTEDFPVWVTHRELQSDKKTELAVAKTPQTCSGFYIMSFALYCGDWKCKK